MSRLGMALGRFIPVTAHASDRAPVAAPAPSPEVGRRWGRGSRFEIGSRPEPDEEGNGAVARRDVHKDVLIRGIESHREYEVNQVAIGGETIQIEGAGSVTFYIGQSEVVHEDRKVRGSVTFIQPTIETIDEYVTFDFDFGVSGFRGEPHPPETPELDLDSLYADEG